MRHIIKISLVAVFTIILGTIAQAKISNKSHIEHDTMSQYNSLSQKLDGHTKNNLISLELPALSSKNSTKVAGVRFISNTTDEGFYNTGSIEYQCPSNFNKTCTSPAVGSGVSCGGKYEACTCPAEYKYQIAADCPDGQTPDTSTLPCNGKYKSCSCSSDYKTTCSGSNLSVKSGAIACNGKYKETDCQCPAGWFSTATCASPKELSGGSCQAYSGAQTLREKCACPASYLKCDNGPELAGSTPSCKNENESFTRYTKCKQAVVTCESSIKDAKPDYKIIKTIAELKAATMSGADLVILNDISETTQNGTNGIYIGNDTKIHSAKTIVPGQCPDTKLSLDIINLNGKSTIDTTIDSFKIEYSGASVIASKEIKTKNIIINNGTNILSGDKAKLVATINTHIKGGTFQANNLYSEAVQVDKGANLVLTGTGRVENTLNVNAGAILNFTGLDGAKYNLNVLKLTGDATAGKTTIFLGSNATVYTKEKDKDITTNIGWPVTFDAAGWSGTEFEMILNNSTFDMRHSKFHYKGSSASKPFIIRLQNGSKFLNMSGVTFWGGNGVQFIFDVGSKDSQMTITGTKGTGTCTASKDSIVKPTTKTKPAYIKLMNESVMVFVCALGNQEKSSDYFCERYAYCNNISGYADTCEYANNTKPKYAVSTCASCTRFSTTYYANLGSNCKKDCCAEWSDTVYQQCPTDPNNSGYKPCRYGALMTYNSCKSSSYGQVSGYCQADYENISNYY